jgi:pyruvate/2-oxoglutarate dehydrogenase complex dihydrolipoamide dehydrogenase (E3) component
MSDISQTSAANPTVVDIVVIGAGPAGEVLAGRTAAAGLSTAIVEERLVGGECGFYACMPSKALLRPGEALDEVRRVAGALEAANGQLAVRAILERRDAIISNLDDSSQVSWLEDNDIWLFRGRGRIAGEKRVAVGDEELIAQVAVVIAVGSVPTLPDIEGLAQAKPWTNREATTSNVIPERLVIIGGGVVGSEMAQAYTSLGAKVTVLEHSAQLLAKEEPWAAQQVTDRLREQGAEVVLNANVAKVVRPDGAGEVTVELDDGRSFSGDELLVAAGRHIESAQLGLDTIGVTPGRHGYLAVDEHLRVPAHDWLWVVGDANGRALLTHMAKHQARVAGDQITGKSDSVLWDRADATGAPRVTFTEPQVAAVGLTERAARDAGIDVHVVSVGTSANAGGTFWGTGATGTSQLVIDTQRGVAIGATFTGADVQDMLQAATFAIVGELTLDQLWHGIAPFPTRSEIWLNLLEAAGL